MDKGKDYLESLLNSRYGDNTDRSKERIFTGKDILEAFKKGYKEGVSDSINLLKDKENELV